jgi:entericidin B
MESESMTKKLVLLLVAAGVCLGASACNTVKGLGRDIQSVGQAGSDAINQ